MEKDNSNEEKTTPKKRSFGAKLLQGALWLIGVFILLMLLITMLFQFEGFQNYAVDKLTQKLSKDLDAKVELDHINFKIFDELILDSFYVEDYDGDTLLFSEKLVVNFNSSLFSLVKSNLEVSDITLQNARLNLNRNIGEEKNNLNQLLEKLFPPKTDNEDKPKKPFYFDAEKLYLENVSFEKDDKINGERLLIFVKKGTIEIEDIDLQNNLFIVNSAKFEDSFVEVDSYEKNPLPEDSTQIVEVDETKKLSKDSLYKPFQLLIHDFDFGDGKFSLHNYRKSPTKTTPAEELDFTHLEVFDIQIAIDSFKMSDLDFVGKLQQLSAKDESGFVLENLSAPEVKINSRKTQLNGVNLVTPYSQVQDTIIFSYREYKSFKDFENEVNLNLKLDQSKVAIRDIIAFAPKLKKNKFFANNSDEVIRIDGFVKGDINSLRGRDLKLVLGKNTIFEGDFDTKELTKKGSEILNVGIDKLESDVMSLRELIPNFNPPANFNKLGNVSFKGRFDGYFADFVAYGKLKTDLGTADMDMNLDLNKGKAGAEYSGGLNLVDFDLGRWIGDGQLGKITLTSKITNGKGLTRTTAQANIDANVDQFTFRNYTYHDFKMDGDLKENLFDGDFIIKDKNIDFTFNGIVNFVDSIPVFDFKANVNTLNLSKLNLAKQDLAISGEMDLNITDINISNLKGNAEFRNLSMVKDGKEKYTIDTLYFSSLFDAQRQRILSAESELFKGKIKGDYDIEEVLDVFTFFIEKNHPEVAQKLGITGKRKVINSKAFDFDIEIIDSKNFTHLINPKLDTIKNLFVIGSYDGYNEKIDVKLDVEEITYDKIELGNIHWDSKATTTTGSLVSSQPFYAIINNNNIPEINLSTELNKDTVLFSIGASGERKTFDQFDIGGKLFFADGGFNISLNNKDLMLFGEEWTIAENNFIQLGKRVLQTENFVLENRDRIVSINDIDKKGLHLRLENFNTGFIDSIWNYRQLDFAGNYSVDVKAKDIYEMKDFEALIFSDTFLVNGDDWGELKVNVDLADLKSEALVDFNITRNLREMSLKGFYILPSTKKTLTQKTYEPNYFEFKLNLFNYPLNISEYFIGQHVSDTEGFVNMDVDLNGFPKKINSSGNAQIIGGGITVNYLNVRYSFGSEENPTNVKINNSLFDFSGNRMTDKFGNIATVQGGITHAHLRYPGLDARIYSDRLLVLDTDKFDNPLYYGQGIGEVDATFNGRFQKVDVDVKAKTGKGSKMSIPVEYGQNNSSEITFIRFGKKDSEEEKTSVGREARGMEVTMKVDMTEDCEVSLIFDERAGEVVRGSGTGPLTMIVPRGGEDIELHGLYTIAEGDYLFNWYNLVNKKFKVNRGGTIRWTGDPFGADINLDAYYDQFKTSTYNFIQEYIELANDDLKASARKIANVDLKMNLSGDLLKPDIKFDITFPALANGSIKNYVDTKLRILRQDQNEMNRQVFGLMVIGSFLPSGQDALDGSELTASGINTVSEYLSTRLSMYVTELLSEAFSESGFISGVDFNIAYNVYESGQVNLDPQGGGDNLILTGSEMQVNFSPQFKNDRWVLDGSVTRSTGNASGEVFVGGDFALEYFLTDDRRFKVRFYQRFDQALEGGARNRTGFGINYRRQFNTFGEFFKNMKRAAKKSTPKKTDF